MSFVTSDADPVLVPVAVSALTSGAHPARAAMMVYLVDWKAAIEGGSQATSIAWTVDANGRLHVDPIVEAVRSVASAMRYVDQVRAMLSLTEGGRRDGLEGFAAIATEHVVRTCIGMSDAEIDVLVRSTHPIISGGEGVRVLDLGSLAAEYLALRDAA